jgi:WhiB family redox-sensing transcriptional regulator
MSPQVHVMRGSSGSRRAGINNAPAFDGSQPCRSMDLAVFFPDDRVEEQRAAREIKAVCKTCSFQKACLEWAVKYSERGIWAGTTEEERRLMRRRMKAHA